MVKHRMHKKIASISKYRRGVPLLVILFLVVGIVLSLEQLKTRQDERSLAQQARDCIVDAESIKIKDREQRMFDLINAYRVQNGLPALTWTFTLKRAAAWMSKDAIKRGDVSHMDSLGRTPDTRYFDCGVPGTNNYGENITTGAPSADEVFNAWKLSQEHKNVMINPAYTNGAVAAEIAQGGQFTYWVFTTYGPLGGNLTPTLGPTSPASPGSPGSPSSTVQPTMRISPTITASPSRVISPTITISPTRVISPTISRTLTGTVTPSPTKSVSPTQSVEPTSPVQNTEEPTPTSGPVTVDMQINVKVKLAGIGRDGNPSPLRQSRRIQAIVYGTGKEPVAMGTAFLSYDREENFSGIIHLGRMNQGVYFIKLVGDNTLQVLAKPEFQNLKINQVNQIPLVTLFQGDVEHDNVLNINDYNIALACFQDKRCDTKDMLDLNDDGITDVKDYNLLLRSFGQLQGH